MFTRLPLLACAIVLAMVPISSGQGKDSCPMASLPSGAQAVLGRQYGEWRPKRVSDLGADDKKIWAETHPKDCPGIAIGHFEKPDQLAYAVLLVPKSQSSHGYRIVVLSKVATGDSYAATVLDQGDAQDADSGMVISTAPRGSYSDFEGTASVQVKLDAVNVEWIEKAAVLYYWAHGKYQTLQTED
ncbi:MAG TPA: hypothetical protein VKQ11_02645 [Candidatus Sulfotelmatobacter sp.]|nr:hypothetical protein [Candidatus Sulfotelmatobacter sp.]